MVEMVERVTKAILPAFDHIPDPEYRKTIAMSWARAAIEIMRKPTDDGISSNREQREGGRPMDTVGRTSPQGALNKPWRLMHHNNDDGSIAWEVWTDDLFHRVCSLRDDDNPAAMRDATHIVELHNQMFAVKPATVA